LFDINQVIFSPTKLNYEYKYLVKKSRPFDNKTYKKILKDQQNNILSHSFTNFFFINYFLFQGSNSNNLKTLGFFRKFFISNFLNEFKKVTYIFYNLGFNNHKVLFLDNSSKTMLNLYTSFYSEFYGTSFLVKSNNFLKLLYRSRKNISRSMFKSILKDLDVHTLIFFNLPKNVYTFNLMSTLNLFTISLSNKPIYNNFIDIDIRLKDTSVFYKYHCFWIMFETYRAGKVFKAVNESKSNLF